MAPGSSSWLDPTVGLLLLDVNVAASGNGRLNVPNDPSVLGVRSNVQSFSLAPNAFPLGSSNAVSFVVGN